MKSSAANYFIVEVPGAANRSLSFGTHSFPKIVVANKLTGSVPLLNSGDVGVRYRGEAIIDSARNGDRMATIGIGDATARSILPKGVKKTLTYEWELQGPFAFVEPVVEVNFNNGDGGLDVVGSEANSVLVVSPLVVKVLAAIAAVVVLWAFLRGLRGLYRRRKLPRSSVVGEGTSDISEN